MDRTGGAVQFEDACTAVNAVKRLTNGFLIWTAGCRGSQWAANRGDNTVHGKDRCTAGVRVE